MNLPVLKFKYIAAARILPLLLFLGFIKPVLAHHPFGMGDSSQLTIFQGLLSGIGHPLLGPDHLLFILAIAFVGLRKPTKWCFPLLVIGLGGSAFAQQMQPLPEFLATWIEALVSLSLALEGLIILNFLSSKWLLPMFALHGYLLGSTIIGAEATPLIGYFLGLLLSQAFLLSLVTTISQRIINWLGTNEKLLIAGILIGIGSAFSWVALVD